MKRRVLIAGDAREDMLALYAYITANDSALRAELVLGRLQEACHSLAEQSFRGNVPVELQPLGVKDFREIHVGLYRIVYRVEEAGVVVYGVADGRRDMQGFLARRLAR